MIDQYPYYAYDDTISLIVCRSLYRSLASPVTGHTSYTMRITLYTYFALLLAASLGSSSATGTKAGSKGSNSSKGSKGSKSSKGSNSSKGGDYSRG
jgi:hypothetical protein